jgi:hypothetical protein
MPMTRAAHTLYSGVPVQSRSDTVASPPGEGHNSAEQGESG